MVKSMVEIFQNFLAFSEEMNFTLNCFECNIHHYWSLMIWYVSDHEPHCKYIGIQKYNF
jgi:hypothetical protein